MPNGIDKNWYRMCAAINGFRARYGDWPSRIRTPRNAITHLFLESTLERINSQVEIIDDGSPFIAEDDLGRSYNYAEEGFTEEPPDIDAHEWLDFNPDSQMVVDYFGTPPDIQPSPVDQTPPAKQRLSLKAGCLTIALSELLLFVLASIGFWIFALITFDGQCISFEMPRACSLGQYVKEMLLFTPFFLAILAFMYWWLSIPLAVLFPVIGLRIAPRLVRKKENGGSG